MCVCVCVFCVRICVRVSIVAILRVTLDFAVPLSRHTPCVHPPLALPLRPLTPPGPAAADAAQGKLEGKAEAYTEAERFYQDAIVVCETVFGKGSAESGSPIFVSAAAESVQGASSCCIILAKGALAAPPCGSGAGRMPGREGHKPCA